MLPPTAYALPVFALLIIAEVIYGAYRHQQTYTLNDTWGSLSQLVLNIIVSLLFKGLALGFNMWVFQFALVDLGSSWVTWVGVFVAIDFVFYWYHRTSHRSRLFWCVHSIHHSSKQFNFSTALRQSWLGPVSKLPFFAVLPLLGFDPVMVATAGAFLTIIGFWGHTRHIRKLWRPIEWLFNTPSHHRVHHGSNPEYVDKNYGNLFIVWDRLFGTFEPERAEVKYGLTTNIDTYNPLRIATVEFAKTIGKVTEVKGFRNKFVVLFGPP